MINQLKQWLIDHKIGFKNKSNLFTIEDKLYLLLEHKSGAIIDDDMSLIINEEEYEYFDDIDFVIFLFGTKFYYTSKETVLNPEFNLSEPTHSLTARKYLVASLL